MGSPQERHAMEFALGKFREFGLDDVRIMEMHTAESEMTHTNVNTASGIAIGVLKGKTDSIIVIGGHIDSAGPNIPGANDDGSGSACVIELARVLAKEQHNSTLVFCLFGGEESGLCGSKYFVKHFPWIDKVILMMEVDMANGSDILIPTIDDESGNAPVWLVQAAYEEFGKLGYSGLKYPTHFFTLMSMLPGGGVGSDHEPFLEHNIPAIDFTTDINDPIHTPQDDFEHFKPSGLKRSGDLVYALMHRFDQVIPEEKTSSYYLLQIGNRAIFFPLWLLWTFNIVSVLIALFVLWTVRKRRVENDRTSWPKIPGFKLFLLAVIIQTCLWLSENVVGLLKGDRFPWIAHPEGYFILGFLASLVGIVISLRLSQRMNLSKDPYRWFFRAAAFLIIYTGLLSLSNAKVAIYPAFALFFLAVAMLVQKPWLKLCFWILSPHFMFRLIFSEGFVFFARGTALHATQPLWMYAVLHIFYVLFFALWSFPFLLGFAAVYFDSGIDLLWLKKWKIRISLSTTLLLSILCSVILVFFPSYSDEWFPNIITNQFLDMNSRKGKITLKSNEYLRHIQIHLAEKDTVISTWDREMTLKEFTYDRPLWITIDRKVTTIKRNVKTQNDTNAVFDILLQLHFKYRPQKFSLSYSTAKNKIEDVSTLFATETTPRKITMRWESFPDTTLSVPLHFKAAQGDSVIETIEAQFVEMIEPLRIEKEGTNVISRTTIRQNEVIQSLGNN